MMAQSKVDAVVVGAGFAGLYALYSLRQLGLAAQAFEAGDGVGGTWYWNRYPGARCDTPSFEYSYAFSEELEQEWDWSERYPAQPEILRYAEHVADRFDLKRNIQFNTKVASARFDDAVGRWTVTTDKGDVVDAQFVILAVGCLSTANLPKIAGLEGFHGEVYHTGRWPHEAVDLSGKRVGVIGTGSSGIQLIPEVAKQAAELTVFQRTPQYSIPSRNRPLRDGEQDAVKADYRGLRERNRSTQAGFGSDWKPNPFSALEASEEERQKEFEARWESGGFGFMSAYNDLSRNLDSNVLVADFVRDKIRDIVKDPEKAEILTPTSVIGCKRLCLDTDYFDTFNRPNVRVVDIVAQPIETFTSTGLRSGGRDYPLDTVIFATGFDAMTGSILSIDIQGRNGERLRDAWAAGPVTYLGLGVPGFPNLFPIAGPGSPSVLANVIPAIEQNVEWVTGCIAYLREHKIGRIEAEPGAASAWIAHVNAIADRTLYPTCNSWYLGANIPGKPRVFMPVPGLPAYRDKCDQVAADGYEGFALTP
jgi:cyclohexanone monooxygenase